MRTTTRLASGLTVLALLASMVMPGVASASSKGRRNTAIALGALTLHQALKGKTTNALVLGAGTAYAYKRYRDNRKDEQRKERARNYSYRSRTYSRRYR